ncbi:hypothetical protein CN918_27315 [Priestia megaterium]|nr:hypothetical protein CN918_27315 [Priestia megaterium]
MQKKMKLQQILIVFLALVISIILVTLLAGRNNTTTIVVVASDKVDTNKKLNEQRQYFQEKKILKSEMKNFGEGALVTSLSQLEDQYLRFELPVGTPIPTKYLSSKKKSGEFAAEMTKYHTVFKIVDGKAALPPEVQPGDKIDVMLTLEPKDKEAGLITGPLLTDVTVQSIEETNVYVVVTQSQFNKLALGQEIGKFVLQLPGQKSDSLACSDVDSKSKDDVTCYTDADKPSTISEFELRDFVEKNSALSNANSTLKEVTKGVDEATTDLTEDTSSDPTVIEKPE